MVTPAINRSIEIRAMFDQQLCSLEPVASFTYQFNTSVVFAGLLHLTNTLQQLVLINEVEEWEPEGHNAERP
jgi:hypothetical protein